MSTSDTFEEVPGLPHKGDEPHLLREILRTHQTMIGVFSRRVGMPLARLALLRLLAGNEPGGLGVMEMARRLDVNAAAITRQVQEMESAGLIVRRADKRDARRHSVCLTRKGLETFQQIHERAHRFERSLGACISDADMATAAKVLAQLRTALEDLR